jgi:hypothetical protein
MPMALSSEELDDEAVVELLLRGGTGGSNQEQLEQNYTMTLADVDREISEANSITSNSVRSNGNPRRKLRGRGYNKPSLASRLAGTGPLASTLSTTERIHQLGGSMNLSKSGGILSWNRIHMDDDMKVSPHLRPSSAPGNSPWQIKDGSKSPQARQRRRQAKAKSLAASTPATAAKKMEGSWSATQSTVGTPATVQSSPQSTLQSTQDITSTTLTSENLALTTRDRSSHSSAVTRKASGSSTGGYKKCSLRKASGVFVERAKELTAAELAAYFTDPQFEEACSKVGIDMRVELRFLPFKHFLTESEEDGFIPIPVSPSHARICHAHYEKRRVMKLSMILAEYARVDADLKKLKNAEVMI